MKRNAEEDVALTRCYIQAERGTKKNSTPLLQIIMVQHTRVVGNRTTTGLEATNVLSVFIPPSATIVWHQIPSIPTNTCHCQKTPDIPKGRHGFPWSGRGFKSTFWNLQLPSYLNLRYWYWLLEICLIVRYNSTIKIPFTQADLLYLLKARLYMDHVSSK